MKVEELIEFVEPFYSDKDEMHGLDHVERVLDRALEMAENYDVDEYVLRSACYLHGVIEDHEEAAVDFLDSKGLTAERQRDIIEAAKGSIKGSEPGSVEGKVLHDAHLLEGGETFHVVKSLIAGKERGQEFMESLEYLEENILGEYSCVLAGNQEEYNRKEKFARDFIKKLREDLETGENSSPENSL